MSPRPTPPERLEKRLARVAREQGLDQERLRRWVSFLALCGVLERAVREGVLGGYCLKGGAAMELRFAQRARATKDLDLALDGDRIKRLDSLAKALSLGFDLFSFRIKSQLRHMEAADAVRLNIAVAYRTRAWQTIEVDLGALATSHIELVEPRVEGLSELGLRVVSPVRCLGLADQIAQKLHACTGPFAKGRARDVLDILLIELLGEVDYSNTANACRRVFEQRSTHAFPPVLTLPDQWRAELEQTARELEFPLRSASAIAERFASFIQALAATHSDG